MKAVIQRVSSASVTIGGKTKSAIAQGLLVLLGIGHELAIPLYEQFCTVMSEAIGRPVGTGEFGANMQVALVNDGPVTICIDTKNKY